MRRRFVANPNPPYGWIEVFEDIVPKRDDLLYGDKLYEGLTATDGTDISSRTKHREYMKKHGLTTMDDFQDYWAKEAIRRAEYYTKGGSVRKKDIVRAIYELENKK